MFHPTHLSKLLSIDSLKQGAVGDPPAKWAVQVMGKNDLFQMLPNRSLCREEVMSFCINKDHGDIETAIIILSWGGMRRDHGRNLLQNSDRLIELIHNLRSNSYQNRTEAFEDFHDSRKKRQIGGLGIGYYTKLISFLAPGLKGYIMDQWVAKSVN
jgi:hypothetical protein